MLRVFTALSVALLVGAHTIAFAQTTPSSPPAAQPAAKAGETPPVPGANSFTEGQAKERIESAGFSAVSDLKKDDQGIWRATAKRGDKQVNVALDFRGNVVAQD